MTRRQPNKQSDQRLLAAIQSFVAAHSDPAVRAFQESIENWGHTWQGMPPAHLPAADTLSQTLSLAVPRTRDLLVLFVEAAGSRRWEQSYSKADGLVGDDMLAGYGFAEIIGKWGPFVSQRVRAGIGVWGPDIVYPPHAHVAEEVYVLLAGRAEFLLGDGPAGMRHAGEAVHVPSMTRHGFRTRELPLAVFYIWQAGDLRETSTFG